MGNLGQLARRLHLARQATGVEQIALAMRNIHQATAQSLNELAHSLAQTVAQYPW